MRFGFAASSRYAAGGVLNLKTTTWVAVFLAVLTWSAIQPADRLTWWMEVVPALLGFVILLATRNRFPLTQLVYVQEPMDNVYVGIVPQSAAFSGLGDLEAQLGEELKEKLGALGKEFGLPSESLHILRGSPAHEIHRFAKEHASQLIVIGTHGQRGLQLLLGSTANSVLHGARCDVLSVRIGAAR